MPPVDLAITEATASDAGRLSRFAVKTYVDTFGAGFPSEHELQHHLQTTITPDHWRDYLARDMVLLAHVGAELVGYVQLGPIETPGEIDIHRLYVDRPWQGRGIGSRLLDEAIARAELRGASAIWIDVWEDNFGAQRLYGSRGFVATDLRTPFVLSTGVVDGHDIRMVRRRAESTPR